MLLAGPQEINCEHKLLLVYRILFENPFSMKRVLSHAHGYLFQSVVASFIGESQSCTGHAVE